MAGRLFYALPLRIRARLRQCVRPCQIASAAGLRLRDVSFDLVEIRAEHSADEAAPAIVNINLWNRVDVELLRHGCSPVDDVDLAQRDLRIATRHLFQARREPFARTTPVRVKI